MFFRKSKLTSNDNVPAPASPSYVGRNTVFDGTITSDGEVHIDGLVRGTVMAKICIIDSNGTVEGLVEAEEIEVRGRVVGPLRGHHVHLQEGAHVEGDIVSETIAVDNGAHLQGAVWQSSDPLGKTSAPDASHSRRDPSNLLTNPLWNRIEDDGFRPLKAIRPR